MIQKQPERSRSNYITPEGAQSLLDELKYLWEEDRPRVTEAVAIAAGQGDRSENADYTYGKKRLRQIDGRIHFLKKRLDELTVVDTIPADTDKIYFGAWVTMQSEGSERVIYRVVGRDEIDLDAGLISMESPIGRALMGKRKGEKVTVQRPKGEMTYTIVDVAYRPAHENPPRKRRFLSGEADSLDDEGEAA
jgi:transcription elongation factor GreB